MKKLDSFIFTGALINGKVIPKNPRYVRGSLAMFADSDIRVVVERKRTKRSKEQQGYYWGVILPYISEHTGHTSEELHEVFKHKYLSQKVIWRGGEMSIPRSTTVLSTNEMAEYLTNIILEAGELGIQVPEPDAKEVMRRQSDG